MLIRTEESMNRLIGRLVEAPWVAFDTETQGLNLYSERHKVIGLSFGIPVKDGVETWYVPFRHERGKRLNLDPKLIHAFDSVFQDPNKKLIGWNTKFDCHALWQDKQEVTANVLDAMLAWHLLDENLPNFKLKYVAARKFSKEQVRDDKDLGDLLKSEKMDKGDMRKLSPLEAKDYAEADAELSWRLFVAAVPRLKAEGTLDLFYDVCDYARTIERCERRGIKIDPKLCEQLIEGAAYRSEELLCELKRLAGEDFNPKSHRDCRKWLGKPSTAKAVLESMIEVPGVSELLEYRGHAKALSAFYRPWRDRQDRFHRVHPTFKLHGTVAGRLSCADPNAQQIPRTSSQWAKVKQMIVASTGNVLLSTDLSQAEFRMMAHYVQDPNLLEGYRTGHADIHQQIADEIGIDRQAAKTLNFSIIYGGGVPTVSRQLKCSVSRAKELLTEYHSRFPGVKKFFYDAQRLAERQGYVTLWTGRRRHFPYQGGVRVETNTAMNNIIQGGVAEIVRIGMVRLDGEMLDGAYQIGQVHDECLVECPKRMLYDTARQVKTALETVGSFRVPFTAEQKWGASWGSMTPLE